MKNSTNKKKLQIVLLVLIAVLTLGIGYASITAVNLIINGNGTASAVQENFKVYFTNSTITDGKGTVNIDENDATIGYFDITGLSKVGDYAEATYTVLNNSNGIGADITLQLSNSNNDYFKVTETVADSQLQAGDTTTATVKVEMIKTPIDTNVSTAVTASLLASPIANESATGSDPAEEIRPIPDPYNIYTINNTNDIYIDTDISAGIRTFNSFAAAKQEFGHPAAIAHETENGRVKVSYVAFEKDGKVYYLKGRINSEEVYNANINTLKKVFGEDTWQDICSKTICGSNCFFYQCTSDNIIVTVSNTGSVYVNGPDNSWSCRVGNEGKAGCQ